MRKQSLYIIDEDEMFLLFGGYEVYVIEDGEVLGFYIKHIDAANLEYIYGLPIEYIKGESEEDKERKIKDMIEGTIREEIEIYKNKHAE